MKTIVWALMPFSLWKFYFFTYAYWSLFLPQYSPQATTYKHFNAHLMAPNEWAVESFDFFDKCLMTWL